MTFGTLLLMELAMHVQLSNINILCVICMNYKISKHTNLLYKLRISIKVNVKSIRNGPFIASLTIYNELFFHYLIYLFSPN
jgi:hypothetical protein